MTSNDEHRTAVNQVEELLARRRMAAARELLARTLPNFPDSIDLLLQSARLDWLEDKLDEARTTVLRALELEPESAGARHLLARIHLEQRQLAEAEQVLLSLLKDYPEEPGFYALYATVMLESFNFEKAEALAREALRRDPDHEEALNVHTLSGFISSPTDEQRERLRKLLKDYPDQANTTLRLIQHLLSDGKQRDAYALSRELVQLYPDDTTIVELATELKRNTHWSMLPLWPMVKWGWGAAIGIWFVSIAVFRSGILEKSPLAGYENAIAIVFLAWVVYSWVWPPLLRRLIR